MPSRRAKILIRTMIWVVALSSVGGGGYWTWKKIGPGLFGPKRENKIPISRVAQATISEEIVAVGRVRAVFSTELRSEINGRIVKITATDGQLVKKGHEILQLDQQDILTQLQESDRAIEASKLKLDRTKRDHARQSELEKRGLVTLKDFDDAKTNLALAENERAISEARAANLRDRLAKTIIRAPHDGTLLLRDLNEGQVITGVGAQSGGTLLGEVADMTALMVRTNVNEIDVARVKLGDKARVRIDPLRDAMLDGSVRRIAASALESSSDRTRVFPVDVYIDTPEPRLRPGMSATITFTLATVENVPAVSLSAIFSTADFGRYVFVRTGESFTVRPVEVGIADTRRVQVLSGLELNEEVALTRPLEFLGEIPGTGESAAPKTKPAPPPRSTRG